MTTAIESEIARSLPSDPPCPRCGRRYAVKSFKPRMQRPTFHCDPARTIGGCNHSWDSK